MKKKDIEKILSLAADSEQLAGADKLSGLIGGGTELSADELDDVMAAAGSDKVRFQMLLDRIDKEKDEK